jgi:hypothetical protein
MNRKAKVGDTFPGNVAKDGDKYFIKWQVKPKLGIWIV